MMKQPIQDGGGEHLIPGKDARLFPKALIGCPDHGPLLISAAYHEKTK